MSKTVIVKDAAVAEAFKQLGIDAKVEGAEPTEEVTLLKGQVDTLNAKIVELEEAAKSGSTTNPDSISKADFEKSIGSVGLIQKAVLDSITAIDARIDEFSKSITEKIEAIEDDVTKIATESLPRKSVNKTAVIKKAFELDEESGNKQLSKSHHAKHIVDLFDSLSDEGENKGMYADAAMRFETSREITKAVMSDLSANHGIEIIA